MTNGVSKHYVDNDPSAANRIGAAWLNAVDQAVFQGNTIIFQPTGGGVDETANFQAAIAAVGSVGTIVIPTGTFKANINTGNSRINFVGQGMQRTILSPYDSTLPTLLAGGNTGWTNGRVCQLTFQGATPGSAIGTAVQFGSIPYATNDAYHGRWFFEHVEFLDWNKCLNRLYGNIGVWGRGCQFGNANYHIWGASNSSPAMHAGNMRWQECHFQSAQLAHLYIDSSIASYQIVYDSCIHEQNPGFLYFLWNFNSTGNSPGVTINDGVQEGNYTASSVIVEGNVYTPGFLYARNSQQVDVNRSTLGPVTLINSQLTTTACTIDSLAVTQDADSSVINNDAFADVPQATVSGYTSSIRNFSRVGSQTGGAVIPNRVALAYQEAQPATGSSFPVILAQALFQDPAGCLFLKIAGTGGDLTSTLVADGVLNRQCQELTVGAVANTKYCYFYPTPALGLNVTVNKYIVWFVSAKLISGTSPSLYIGNNQVYGTIGKITSKTWKTYGCVTYAGASGSFGLALDTGSAGLAAVLRFGEFSFVQFDTKQEAIEYLDSRTMAVTAGKMSSIFWTNGLCPAVGTVGNNTTPSNGARWWAEIDLLHSCVLTGIQYLIGGTGGTDKVIVELHDAAGTLLATSDLAGVLVGTLNTLQAVPFTVPAQINGPGRYFIALQFNGNTARFQTHTLAGNQLITGTAAGTFGTSASIIPGTTFTANQGPIAGTY